MPVIGGTRMVPAPVDVLAAVNSVSNTDGSLTFSPTTGAVVGTLGVPLVADGVTPNDVTINNFLSPGGAAGPAKALISGVVGPVALNAPIILNDNQSLFGHGNNFKQGGSAAFVPGLKFVKGLAWSNAVPVWAQTAYGLPATVDALIIFAGQSCGASGISLDAGSASSAGVNYGAYIHGTDTLHHGVCYRGGIKCTMQDDANLPGAQSSGGARANLEHVFLDNDSAITIDIESVDWKIDGGRFVNGFKIFNGQGNLVSNVHLTGCPGGLLVGSPGVGVVSYSNGSNVITIDNTAHGKLAVGQYVTNAPGQTGIPVGSFVGVLSALSFTLVTATGGVQNCTAPGTAIVAGGGRLDIASYSVGTGSTISDTSVTALDAGALAVGTGIPMPSYVGTVTAGTSFVLVDVSGNPVTPLKTGTSIYIGLPANSWVGSRMGFSNCQFDTVPITALALVYDANNDSRNDQVTYVGCRFHENNANTPHLQMMYRIGTGLAPVKITGSQMSSNSPSSTWNSIVSTTQAGDTIDISAPAACLATPTLAACFPNGILPNYVRVMLDSGVQLATDSAVAPTNGFGITGNTGLTPAPAVSLATAASETVLGADVPLTAQPTTILTSPALTAGATYLITWSCTIQNGTTVNATDVYLALGTATLTSGVLGGTTTGKATAASGVAGPASGTCIVTINAGGTILLVGFPNSLVGPSTAKRFLTAGSTNIPGTIMTCLRIA